MGPYEVLDSLPLEATWSDVWGFGTAVPEAGFELSMH